MKNRRSPSNVGSALSVDGRGNKQCLLSHHAANDGAWTTLIPPYYHALLTPDPIPEPPRLASLRESSLLQLRWLASALHLCQDEQASGAARITAAVYCLPQTRGLRLIPNAQFLTKPASCEAGREGKSWKSSSGRRRVTLRISRHCQMYACFPSFVTFC
jgi:hypothetical protein